MNGTTSDFEECSFEHAAVAADSPESSEIGKYIMKDKGGSAVDAAIAAMLCSGVVNAHSCGIGGGAIITYYKRSEGKVYTVNGREQAPSGLQTDVFFNDKLAKRVGGLSICIPGEIQSMYEAWKLGGRLPWRELFQPAIALCKNGFIVRTALANAMNMLIMNENLELKKRVPRFLTFLTNPETGEIYQKGDTMYRPLLAKTLEKIANEGHTTFYKGSLADDIVLDIMDGNGIISKDDLANYTSPVIPPISLQLNDDLTVYSPTVPSSGIQYQFILNLLKDFKFDSSSLSTTEKSVSTWHRIIEAFKHATALKYGLGDIDVCADDIKHSIQETLTKALDDDYVKSKHAQIKETRTFDAEYYDPLKTGNQHEDHGTSHLCILAPDGDAVSVTSTVSLFFGSKVVGTRTGIAFNDEMRNFSLPNVKNRYNGPPVESNFAEPLRRPLTSMCPSIVVDKNGDVKLVVGASGSIRIPTSMALVTMGTLWFNRSIKESIDYPRVHHQLYPPKVMIETGFPEELINGLQRIGHEVTNAIHLSVVQGILRRGKKITAYSDYRKEGKASGF